MSKASAESVWVTKTAESAPSRYHISPTCHADVIRSGVEVSLAEAEKQGLDECKFCSGRRTSVYEGEHVQPEDDRRLVASTRSTPGKLHYFDPDAPEDTPRPLCGVELQKERSSWRVHDLETWPDKGDCKLCQAALDKRELVE